MALVPQRGIQQDTPFERFTEQENDVCIVFGTFVCKGLLPVQMHGSVVLVESDLKSSVGATDEFGRDGAGQADRLVRRLGAQADDVFSSRHLECLRLSSPDSVEYNETLLRPTAQRASQR